MTNNKRKSFYSLLLVFAMVLQIVAPAFANTVIAEEEIKAESEEILYREDGDTSENEKEDEVNQNLETSDNDQLSEEVEEKPEEVEEKPEEEKTETEDENKNEQEENSSTSDPQENESTDEGSDENETETNGDKTGFHLVLDRATQGPNDEPFSEVNPLNPTDEFFMHYKWSLDEGHGYDAGDTVSFQLPKQLNILANADGELADPSGTVFANYHVSMDGTVTFTFTEAVNQMSDIKGDFFIKSKLNPSETEIDDGKVTIGPMEEEGHLDIPVNTSDMVANISKAGTPLPAFSPKEIEWTITVDSKMLKHKDGKITDMLPPGLTYKPGSIIINGEKAAEPTIDGQNLEITLGDFSGTKTITFITTIDDEHWDDKSFHNKASYESTGVDKIEAGASVTIDRGEPLSKKGGHYNPVTQEIEWEIELNFNGKTVTDTTLQDRWTEGLMELVDGSLEFYEVSIDDNGNATTSEFSSKIAHEVKKIGDKGFKVTIPEIDKPYIVKYKTKLNERLIEGQNISNGVKWDGNTSEGSVWAEQGVGYKGHSNVSYKDKTVDWTLVANTDEKDMTKFIINDTFGSGLTLKEDTFVVTVGGKTLTKGTDYTFTATDNGFTIQFIGAFETLKKAVEVKYTTDFDYTKLKPGENFTNHAKYTWYTEGKDTPWEKEVNDGFTPDDFTKHDGNKSGYYDARDKTITWTIAVNYQQNAHEELIVKDLIQGNQKLLPDTIKVSEGVLGGGNNSIWAGNEITDANVTKPEVDGKPGFIVNLGKTDKPYVITYKTSLEGLDYIEKNYKNTANVFDGTNPLTDLPADVGITQGGKYGGKTGKQNGKAIDWTVTVNESQAKVQDVVLTDTLSANQEFLQDTIKVYATTVDNFGNITKGAAYDNVTINVREEAPQELTVKFNETIDRPYIVEYSTLYFAGHNEIVSNKYKVTGSNIGDKGQQGGIESVTIDQSTGGSASGTVGHLKVKKIAYDDENKVFEGIKFQLIDPSNQRVLKTGVTDKEGNINFGRLMFGKYLLKEIEAPEGYQSLPKPILITINKDTTKKNKKDENEKEVIVKNYPLGHLVIMKTEQDNEIPLPIIGVEFILEKKDTDGRWAEVERLITGDRGIAVSEKLEAGDYRFKEGNVPEGVIIPDEKDYNYFTVKEELHEFTFNIKNIRTKLLINLLKLDESDNTKVLEGAVFDLYKKIGEKENGEEIYEILFKGLTTDKDGKISHRVYEPGKYRLIETKAPEGYYIDNDEKHIDIDVNYADSEELVNIRENGIIVSSEKNYNIKFTNKKTPNKNIEITKFWDEVDPSYRPEELEFTISANGQPLNIKPELISTEDKEWEYIYKDLPIYDREGKLIVYLIEEVEHEGYEVSYLEKGAEIGLEEIEITNKQKVKDIQITKIWDEVDPSYRPEELEFKISANGQPLNIKPELISTEDKEWEYIYKDLPIYDREGKLIVYLIEEVEHGGYDVSYLETGGEIGLEEIEITNKQKVKDIQITKFWDEVDPSYRPEELEFKISANGQPLNIKPELITDEGNGWKYIYKDLPIYDREGKLIVYLIEEVEHKGYDVSYLETGGEIGLEEIEITNKQKIKEIQITKFWDEVDPSYRPEELEFTISANDEVLDVNPELVSDEGNEWKYIYKDLPIYDSKGELIVYLIEEVEHRGYDVSYLEKGGKIGLEEIEITNKQKTTSLSVEKTWDEVDSFYRPEQIAINLLANGEHYKTVTMKYSNSLDKWTHTFENLPKYDREGKLIKYTIEEAEVIEASLKGYEVSEVVYENQDTEEDKTIIAKLTNTQEKTSISGKKVWKDDNSTERPETIKVDVMHGSRLVKTVDIKVDNHRDNEWKFTISNLAKYDSEGKEIVYTIKEHEVEGYESAIEDFDITNTRVGKRDIVVSKSWKDDNSTSRPSVIKVDLLANGEIKETVEISSKDKWEYTFTDLDKYDSEGKEIVYTIKEHAVEGYESVIEDFDITNTRVGKRDIVVSKSWKDDNSTSRPSLIKVDLLANGEIKETVEISSKDKWEYTFTDLDKYDSEGKEIVYTIKEHEVEGYETIIDGFKITNKLKPTDPNGGINPGEHNPGKDPNGGIKPGEHNPGGSPTTGDRGIWMYLSLLVVALVSVVFLRKRQAIK